MTERDWSPDVVVSSCSCQYVQLSVREDAERTVPVDEHHGLVRPARLVAAHAGAVGWHAGQRQTGGVGSIGQQTPDRFGRHVSFDRVAVDDRGVARGGTVGYPDRPPELGARRIIGHLDRGAVRSQVPDPR